MADEMQATIEKIKLQEQDKEAKLKERRAFEATLATVKRNLQENVIRTTKLKYELAECTARADKMKAELMTAQVLRSSLSAQLEVSDKELQHLKIKSKQCIAKVWAHRNVLCDAVQKTSDQCDIWALFTRPKFTELPKPKKSNENTNQADQAKGLLENVIKRRESLMTERDRLLNEPEFGEEFKRIKNALRYSVEKATQNRRL